jgi:hypothetical protein
MCDSAFRRGGDGRRRPAAESRLGAELGSAQTTLATRRMPGTCLSGRVAGDGAGSVRGAVDGEGVRKGDHINGFAVSMVLP